jgi:septal ring factor EnvC (AmiA/AmiB activator)
VTLQNEQTGLRREVSTMEETVAEQTRRIERLENERPRRQLEAAREDDQESSD